MNTSTLVLRPKLQFFYQRVVVPVWLLGTLTLSFMYLSTRYTIGYAVQEARCVDHSYFLIDKFDKEIVRGKYFYFKARNMGPYFDDSWNVVKVAAGLPGDIYSVSKEEVKVFGVTYGGLDDKILEKLEKDASYYTRNGTVPEGKLIALGTLPRSYDGRYWGFVDFEEQVIGRAYGIF